MRSFERLPRLRPALPWLLLAVSLTVNVLFGAGWVYQQIWGADRPRELADRLGLNDQQRAALQEARSKIAERARDIRQENRLLIDQLWSELQKPRTDTAKIEQLIDEITQNRATLTRLQVLSLVDAAGAMDDRQRQEFLRIARTRMSPGEASRR